MALHYDDKGKFYTEYVSKDAVNAIIQTLLQRITGKIFVRAGDRVSDELNRSNQFLAVTEATVFDLEGVLLYQCGFISINREHIIWIIPEETGQAGNEQGGDPE